MREIIGTAGVPRSPSYSQAVKATERIYISGLVGIGASTRELAGSTIQE